MLSGLQSKGIIEASLDRPVKFSVSPIQNSLNLLIEAQKNRASMLEKSKEHLLKRWSMIQVPPPEEEGERLQMLKGSEQIYARISEIMDRATRAIGLITINKRRLNNAGSKD